MFYFLRIKSIIIVLSPDMTLSCFLILTSPPLHSHSLVQVGGMQCLQCFLMAMFTDWRKCHTDTRRNGRFSQSRCSISVHLNSE